MKTVIQRVKYASVTIEEEVHGKINQGYMILVGIKNEDTPEIVSRMADKIANLRIFEDADGTRSAMELQAPVRPLASGAGGQQHAVDHGHGHGHGAAKH